jgi:hypothetical protein
VARAKALALATCALLASVLLSGRAAIGHQAETFATVTIGADSGMSIAPTFAGFSYEKSVLSEPLFSATNEPLVRLFRMLGRGILRVGGNSVNETTWSPFHSTPAKQVTAPADIDRLAGFLRATDWKVIYGLNATVSEAGVIADEAAYASSALGDRMYGLEIGNEPDLYRFNGLKPKTYGFADFLADWEFRAAKVRAKVPHAAMTGPAAFDYSAYAAPFAAEESTRISLLTEHYYRGNGLAATSTVDLMLSPDPDLEKMLVALSRAASDNHIAQGYRVAEANSFYNGGAPGISNAFGSALWAFAFCSSLAQRGASGVNFHGGGSSPGYTPIADGRGNVVAVRPVFYGLLLFSMMAHDVLLTSHVSGSADALSSLATAGRDGRLDVVLTNGSRTASAGVRVALPASIVSATALVLSAPSLDSTVGISLGGAEIEPHSPWHPAKVFDVPAERASIAIDVPPGSMVLIRARLQR